MIPRINQKGSGCSIEFDHSLARGVFKRVYLASDDIQVKPLSRTAGPNCGGDELIVSFTHDREMRAYLPGVVPTGWKVVLPHVVLMGFDDAGRISYEHIYWDQAALLVQVGLRPHVSHEIGRIEAFVGPMRLAPGE
jgi:hypothetical protein